MEVVEREPGMRGFSVQPRRWVIERSFAWLIRNRRLAKDYERTVQTSETSETSETSGTSETSETLIELAAARLLLRRLGGPEARTRGGG